MKRTGINGIVVYTSLSVQDSRRKVIVEPPIGQIKHARGFRQFSMRGKDKARGEWSLVCMTHNILRWFAVAGRAG